VRVCVRVCVRQRYITNPYLVGGKKFDMRIYVLVTSYMPLTVWLYRRSALHAPMHIYIFVCVRMYGTPMTMLPPDRAILWRVVLHCRALWRNFRYLCGLLFVGDSINGMCQT